MASVIAPNLSQLRPALARLPRLPDLLTTANLGCGVASILLASQGQLTIACGLIFLGALFDVFDGLAARALGGGSPLGAQLDSLADMVTFGVAPALIIWSGFTHGWSGDPVRADGSYPDALPFMVAAIPIASAWRLAKFNVDTRQSTGFLGLATPANALFWASLPLIAMDIAVVHGPGADPLRGLCTEPLLHLPALGLIVLVLCALMLSELPLPSLKFKHGGWKGNEVIFLLLGIGVVLAALYGILAVPLVLVLYALSPVWRKAFRASSR